MDAFANSLDRQVVAVFAKWILNFLGDHFEACQNVKYKHHEWNDQKVQTKNVTDRKCETVGKDEFLDE
jgi:hypothetical protein